MTLMTVLMQGSWTREFSSLAALKEFADRAGFGPPEELGARIVRRHADGVLLHHAAWTDQPLLVTVGRAESLDGPEGPYGLLHESAAERTRRDVGIAYENVTAAAALLRIDIRAEPVGHPEHSRRGAACGFLDMAAVHLGQNLPAAARSRHAERGDAAGEARRPNVQDTP